MKMASQWGGRIRILEPSKKRRLKVVPWRPRGGQSKTFLKVCQNWSDCRGSEVEMVSSALMCCGYRMRFSVCRVQVLKPRVCAEDSGF